MQLQVSLFVALTHLLSHGVVAINSKIRTVEEAVENSFFVRVKDHDDPTAASVQERADALSAENPNVRVTKIYKLAIQGFAAEMTLADAEVMAESEEVLYIESNAIAKADEYSWGLDRSDQRDLPLDDSFTPHADGSGVTAYVIDTGILTTHNDFGGRASWGTNTIDDQDEDCDDHGTHVAGTVGGTVYGVAKKVDLVAVKVLDCDGGGSLFSILDGIEWVMENAKKPATANMSLGFSLQLDSVDEATNNLHNSGVVTVVAAGNSDDNTCKYSPAAAEDAITVGATDDEDVRAWFSNYGKCVDILAPGVDIKSAVIGSDDATGIKSGTSMASPHVCGGAALYLGAGMDPADVTEALLGSATPDKLKDLNNSPNLLLYVGEGAGSAECIDSPTPMIIKKSADIFCNELTDAQCEKKPKFSHCPVRCDKCEKFMCKDSKHAMRVDRRKFRCARLKSLSAVKKAKKCAKPEIKESCRKSCNYCF